MYHKNDQLKQTYFLNDAENSEKLKVVSMIFGRHSLLVHETLKSAAS